MDTSTATGRLMLTVLGGVAEFERTIMLERQREGIAKAKAAGKYKGRKPTAQAKADLVKQLKADSMGASEISRKLGIGRGQCVPVPVALLGQPHIRLIHPPGLGPGVTSFDYGLFRWTKVPRPLHPLDPDMARPC